MINNGSFRKYPRSNSFLIMLIRNSSRFYGFIYCYNIFRSCLRITNWLFNFFSGTILTSTSSPNSPNVLSDSCNTSETTDVSVSPSGTTYASIMSSSFKLYSYSLVMTLILKNLSTSICFISERTTKCFVGDLSFI